jgi:hypothetical protein
MQTLYFTFAAIAIYLVAERILDLLEQRAGRRFASRSLIFFALMLTLSLASFALIRRILSAP